ncbi:MAG: rod shape-determining protein MreC [Chloroflexi bacterium]|nr:rod shape-determining protein MreC [Chloroflexota bacterium]
MRARSTFYTVLILVLGVGAIFLSQRGWLYPVENIFMRGLAPVQRVGSGIFDPLFSLLVDLRDLHQLREGNERNRKTIDQLTGEVVRLREVDVENQRLKAELNYKKQYPGTEYVSAAIIDHDPSNVIQGVMIDKGTEHGVKQGMVVVSPGGLVGKVTKAYNSSAKVLLITDPSSSVNGMVQRLDSRALGVANGKVKGLEMKYLPQSEVVKTNDLIVTSGLGGGFPKGLFIGRVTDVVRNDLEMFQEAKIEPAVKFSRLEAVMVITNFTPATFQ